MVFYGWAVKNVQTDLVYGILRNALMRIPEDGPFRGPKEYKEMEYIYINSWEGDVERFSGKEKINQGEKLIYGASYIGGLVDERGGV